MRRCTFAGECPEDLDAVRVGRAGWSARSSQLLALIENAAQLSSAAVALHEQMLLVRTHPDLPEVRTEIAQEKIELVRVAETISKAVMRRGGKIDLEDLELADARLEAAIERLRSSTYTEIHDFAILVHIRKLSRCFRSVLDLLKADAEVVANLPTGRSTDSLPAPDGPQKERQSPRFLIRSFGAISPFNRSLSVTRYDLGLRLPSPLRSREFASTARITGSLSQSWSF